MFKLYEVDPEADTLLIVPHPSKPFAPWHDESSEPTPSSSSSSLSTTPSDVYAGILRGTSRPPNIYASIASAPELRIKVSSQHLILASKPFRNRFKYHPQNDDNNNNNNHHHHNEDGRTHITLSPPGAYDPQAVIVVMDILHGRGKKVPRTLPDVETLAKIAVVVDALKVHDAVAVYADRWFAAGWSLSPLPSLAAQEGGETLLFDEAKAHHPNRKDTAASDRALVLWIYASYVFRQAEAFKAATRLAVLRSHGPVRTLGLQVRAGVIREIESRRQKAISAALDIIHTALATLPQDEAPSSCPLGCDTFLLGALVQSLRRANLLAFPFSRRPAASPPSFLGISVGQVAQAVSQAQDLLARQQLVGAGGPSWGLLGGGGGGGGSAVATRKRKTPNAQPVGTLTPESSPEPERFGGGGFRDVHVCEARDGEIGARLEALERGVEGLDLESKLGYCLY